MRSPEDRFELRLGKGRDHSLVSDRFAVRVMRAAGRTGRVSGGRSAGSSNGGMRSRFGRGVSAAFGLKGGRHARRVVVKTHIVRQGISGGASLSRHMIYLEREGVGRDGSDGLMFDADSDEADPKDFAERSSDDRHHFRVIVSPEDAVQMDDLRSFTRELMKNMEWDLDTDLEWQAIDHWNTDNPHVHILIRGKDDLGKDLIISRDYISNGMRGRAQQLVSLELGPRSEQEIRTDLDRQVSAERYTKLDAALIKRQSQIEGSIDLSTGQIGDKYYHNALIGRAQQLDQMGLAISDGPLRWTLHPNAEKILRDLGERGDIIKTMHKAMRRDGRQADPSRFAINTETTKPVVGMLVDRGLHDELTDKAYAIVDGIDGRTHYVRFANIDLTGDADTGSIVERRTWPDSMGRTASALAVRSDFSLKQQVTADGATWLDQELLKQDRSKLGGGFGRDVSNGLDQRLDHLEEQGLVKRQGQRIQFARRLIATLRRGELAKAVHRIADQSGKMHKPSEAGEYLTGGYAKRLDLASGRYALIEHENGRSFELVPWRPALERQRDKQVQGLVMNQGRVDWDIGRQKGRGLGR